MDRYDIISKKRNSKSPRKKAPAKRPPYKIPTDVKTVTQIWVKGDKELVVSFEVSPRGCRCQACRKEIPKQTPRYKVERIVGSWKLKEKYHQKCLPKKYRDFSEKFDRRDLDKEDMNDRFSRITFLIDSMDNPEYKTKLIKKLINHFVK